MLIPSKPMAALVAASLFACAAASATPAPDAAIDLPTAIRLALEQPAARAAAHEVAAGEAALKGAARYPNPELAYLREGGQGGTRTTTVQINQPIELGGKRRARMAVAASAVDSARGELAARRAQVRAEVVGAFYTLLVTREKEELARALADLAGRSVDAAARRVAAGKISRLDETRARLAAVDAVVELNRASAELAIARTRFGAAIGGQAGALAPAQGIEQLPAPAALESLLARLDGAAPVRRAQADLAAQSAQAEAERAARIPDVTLSLGSQREEGVARRQAVVGLALPLPLFDRNQEKLGAALRRRDRAQDELAAVQASAAAELAGLHARFLLARAEATLLRQDVLPHAQSAHALTLKGFEHGKFSLLELLDAQRTLFQARTRYWNTLLDAWRAWAELERLTGATEASAPSASTAPGAHP